MERFLLQSDLEVPHLGKIARSRRISNACDICGLFFWRVWNCDDGIERFFGN